MLDGHQTDEDSGFDLSLRPRGFDEYVGQEPVKENLRVAITAAQARHDVLDHILFHGPPGLGKTSLAYIIGREMGVSVKATSGPVVERPGDLAALLTNLEEGDILFIDEIHRLNHVVEEVLYPAMEDYQIDIMVGQGPAARSRRYSNAPRRFSACAKKATASRRSPAAHAGRRASPTACCAGCGTTLKSKATARSPGG